MKLMLLLFENAAVATCILPVPRKRLLCPVLEAMITHCSGGIGALSALTFQ